MTRILIVDDEEKIREMIRKYAAFEGFETDEASDGLQAVEKCMQNHYDLVVMDINEGLGAEGPVKGIAGG
ncbi:MAG: response regulator, partial [Solobacterium sp.]|nr:response regulator [Solobacterium sp.]